MYRQKVRGRWCTNTGHKQKLLVMSVGLARRHLLGECRDGRWEQLTVIRITTDHVIETLNLLCRLHFHLRFALIQQDTVQAEMAGRMFGR